MAWDQTWETVFQKQEWGKYPGEDVIQFVARNFYSKKDRSSVALLEIGCGPGSNIWYLSREGFSAYGIDGSETAIARAKERLEKEHLHANLVVGDISKLHYRENYFDAVLDVECLCCNSSVDTRGILSEIARVLKPKGLLFSRSFSDQMYVGKGNMAAGENEFKHISDGPLQGKGFVRLMSRKDIDALYREGFDIKTIDLRESTRDNGAVKISEWVIVASVRK